MESAAPQPVRPAARTSEQAYQPVGPADDAFAMDLRKSLGVLLRRWGAIVLVAVVVVGVAALYTLRQRKIYTAKVTLVIEQPPKVLGDQVQDVADQGSSYWQSREFYETQFRILKSEAVADRVVRKLSLDRDQAFLDLTGSTPEERARIWAKPDRAAEILAKRMRVETAKDSRVVSVTVDDHDPQKAALIANTVAEEFMAYSLAQRLGTSRSASEWLHDQVDELQQKLNKSEQALHEYKRENDILTNSLEDSQSIVAKRLSAISDALTAVRTKRAGVAGKVAEVREARRTKSLASLPEVVASTSLQALRAQATVVAQELAEAEKRYGAGHPKLTALHERRDEAQRLIAAEEEHIAQAVEIEEQELARTESNLARLLAEAKREAFAMNSKEVTYSQLRREQDNNSKLVELVMRRLKDVDLSGLLRTNNVRVLDIAKAPIRHSSPKLLLTLLVALALGLAGGVSLAFLLDRLDNTVKTEQDLIKATGANFLGIVPLASAGKKGDGGGGAALQVHLNPKSVAAECLRTVRTNLVFMGTERPLKRLLVTSGMVAEGKSTVAIDLAIIFAQSGERVLLVDSDMRRPRLHRAFGVEGKAGLSNVILDASQLGQALLPTPVPNLTILTSGPVPPNPAELLQTERFVAVCGDLSRRFDRVIFDSPPVSAVADALIIAAQVDGVLMVVRAGKTTKEALARMRRSLAEVQARVVGAVLNGVDFDARDAGYYYQHDAKSSDYFAEPPKAARG